MSRINGRDPLDGTPEPENTLENARQYFAEAIDRLRDGMTHIREYALNTGNDDVLQIQQIFNDFRLLEQDHLTANRANDHGWMNRNRNRYLRIKNTVPNILRTIAHKSIWRNVRGSITALADTLENNTFHDNEGNFEGDFSTIRTAYTNGLHLASDLRDDAFHRLQALQNIIEECMSSPHAEVMMDNRQFASAIGMLQEPMHDIELAFEATGPGFHDRVEEPLRQLNSALRNLDQVIIDLRADRRPQSPERVDERRRATRGGIGGALTPDDDRPDDSDDTDDDFARRADTPARLGDHPREDDLPGTPRQREIFGPDLLRQIHETPANRVVASLGERPNAALAQPAFRTFEQVQARLEEFLDAPTERTLTNLQSVVRQFVRNAEAYLWPHGETQAAPRQRRQISQLEHDTITPRLRYVARALEHITAHGFLRWDNNHSLIHDASSRANALENQRNANLALAEVRRLLGPDVLRVLSEEEAKAPEEQGRIESVVNFIRAGWKSKIIAALAIAIHGQELVTGVGPTDVYRPVIKRVFGKKDPQNQPAGPPPQGPAINQAGPTPAPAPVENVDVRELAEGCQVRRDGDNIVITVSGGKGVNAFIAKAGGGTAQSIGQHLRDGTHILSIPTGLRGAPVRVQVQVWNGAIWQKATADLP